MLSVPEAIPVAAGFLAPGPQAASASAATTAPDFIQVRMPALPPILMLVASNVFMTFAWYGQLKVEHRAIWLIVLISWGIAFFEYCLAVPANRIGRAVYEPSELKAM